MVSVGYSKNILNQIQYSFCMDPKLWTEKYRPKSLNEIADMQSTISEIKSWANEWIHNVPKKKCMIFVGKPGVGKTTLAHALAHDLNWDLVELNASDARNEDVIYSVVKSGAECETFTEEGQFISSIHGKRKLILLDEADNLYEKKVEIDKNDKDKRDYGDYGGKKAIVKTISVSKQPIILTANDSYKLYQGNYGSALRNMSVEIKFKAMTMNSIIKVLRNICRLENVRISDEILKTIIEKNSGDMRGSINDLQILAIGRREVTNADLAVIGIRDREENIYNAMVQVLARKLTLKSAIEELRKIDEDPDYILAWLDENLPAEYLNPVDMNNGLRYLTEADLFLRRVYKNQYYLLWSYASDLMAATTIAKTEVYSKHSKFSYPAYIKELGRTKNLRKSNNKLLLKIGSYMHISTDKVSNEISNFKVIFQKDLEFQNHVIETLKLSDDEISFLNES